MACAVQARLVFVNVLLLIFRGVIRLFLAMLTEKLSGYILAGWMQMRLGPSWLPWGRGLNILYRLWFRPTCKINRAAQWIRIEGRLASSFSPLLASFLLVISSSAPHALFCFLSFLTILFQIFPQFLLLLYLRSLLCFLFFCLGQKRSIFAMANNCEGKPADP